MLIESAALASGITREQLKTTDVELAFGTTRLLPAWSTIPDEFKAKNTYTELVEALFMGRKLPDATVRFRPGFDDAEVASDLNRCVHAHLISYMPKHEHKIAGVAFLVSQVAELERSS